MKTRLIRLGTGGNSRSPECRCPHSGTSSLRDHHSDHNVDYGNVIWLAWCAGLRTRVDGWGTAPLEKMTGLFFEMNAADIDIRIIDEDRVPLVLLVHVHEFSDGGRVSPETTIERSLAHYFCKPQ